MTTRTIITWAGVLLLLGTTSLTLSGNSNAQDVIQIIDIGDAVNVASSGFYLQHVDGASEGYDDDWDLSWAWYFMWVPPPMVNLGVQMYTIPYGVELESDARPTNSFTIFHAFLCATNYTGNSPITSTNSLGVAFIQQDSNREYVVSVYERGQYTPSGTPFSLVTNMVDGTTIPLPGFKNVSNGVAYATIDIYPINSTYTNTPPTIISISSLSSTNLALTSVILPGTFVTVQTTTNAAALGNTASDGGSWTDLAYYFNTNSVSLSYTDSVSSSVPYKWYRIKESNRPN